MAPSKARYCWHFCIYVIHTSLICILFTANAAIAEKRVAFVVGNENTAKWNRPCLQLPPEPPVATREPRRRRRSIYCVFISPR